MCNCQSYNKPEWGGSKKEIILQPPFTNKTVCIDSCIVDEIKQLWNEGFVTFGSCCGHNKSNPNVIVDKNDALKVREYINNNFKRDWIVYAWVLTEF
jgi:hypothetical protein